ncbi:DUF7322 domain-containing protein [Halostagnicola bangensis]
MVFDPFPFEEDDEDSFPLGDESSDDAAFEEDIQKIPRERLMTFVYILVLVQAGLLAGSLGLMLLAIQGQVLVGGGLAVVGVLAFALAAYRYYSHKE